MTTYLTSQEVYGRVEHKIDVQAFAADLAREIGGQYSKPDPDKENYSGGVFFLDGARIEVSQLWNSRTHVTIGISNANRNENETPGGKDYILPSIKVSISRPMAALAKDVKRRLIEPAQEPLKKRREYAQKKRDDSASLVKQSLELRRKYTTLDVRLDNGATYSGTFFNRGGVYLNGRFDRDGKITIDRIGTLTAEQFERVYQALYGE